MTTALTEDLFSLVVGSMLIAKTTILLQFYLVWSIALIFLRVVVTLLTNAASQRDFISDTGFSCHVYTSARF